MKETFDSEERRATGFGLLAIALWSTNVFATRVFLEGAGTLPGSALSLLLAGALLVLWETGRSRGVSWVRLLSWRHVAACGPLFVAYFALLDLALGLAPTRQTAIVAGLVNYLWPTFVLLFSVPLSGLRPRASRFVPGIAVSLGGVVVASSTELVGSAGASVAGRGALLCLVLAFGASVVWGLYSNLARRLGPPVSTGAVGLFLLAAGSVLGLASIGRLPAIHWDASALGGLAYLVVCPLSLGYAFWDLGVRRGRLALLGSASNLIPILSTALSAAALGVRFGIEILGGAGMVVAGTILCQGGSDDGRLRR